MRRALALCALVALASCSARSGSGLVPGASSSTSRASATFTIHWTASATTAARSVAALRRPHFISPSAQSIGIEVSPVGSTDPSQRVTTTINKPSNGATTSTVSIDAPTGNDDILFVEFDQTNLGGNRLGGAEVFQTISLGQANAVNATLDGYVGNVKLNVTGGVATGQDLSGQPVYSLIGAIPMNVVLTLQDADGNTIVAPGTAPIAQITSSNSSLFTVTPVASSPYTYTVRKISPWSDIGLTYPWIPSAAKYLALNVAVASGADGAQRYQTSFSVSGLPAIYATSGVGVSAKMSAFREDGTPVSLPAAFAGLNQPVAMTYDQDDNRIYVADGATNTIQAFGGDGSAVTGWAAPTVPGINSLAYDSTTKTLLAGSNGATPLYGFDSTGASATIGAFAGVGTVVGIAYQRYDIPGAGPCPSRGLTVCGDYYVVYAANGNYYDQVFDDFGKADTGLPTAALLYQFVPNAVGSTQVPNSSVLVTGTYQGSAVACIVPAGGGLTVSAYRCIMTGVTSPSGITGDDYGTTLPRFWIAGAPSGLTYATYDAPGAVGMSPTIDTSISFPTPSGASNFTNVLLVY